MIIRADIHLHTCLSPCAEITQSPKRIVEKARDCKLDLIFITDHNSIANAEAAIKKGKEFNDIRVYPGMEITTREEIHILSLFNKLADAEKMQEEIHKYLPDVFYEKEKEEQIIANELDEVEGYYEKSLFSAVDLSIEEIVELTHKNNGISIPAHIDRESFSVLSQLGFIPDDSKFDALEISPNITDENAKVSYMEYSERFKFVRGSDSHWLENIGSRYTEFEGKENTFEEFLKFIRNK